MRRLLVGRCPRFAACGARVFARRGAGTIWSVYSARGLVAGYIDSAHDDVMRAVATSNNPVRLSFLSVLLADAGIETLLLDTHASIVEGSAGAILQRLVVADDDFPRACRILREAGEW